VNDTARLRTAIIGLIGFAALEEEMLLAAVTRSAPDAGNPQRWAAVPLVAHNTEFKRQQVDRLEAMHTGVTPPAFGEIDHSSDEVYRRYSAEPAGAVLVASRHATGALIDGVGSMSNEDLLDPSRHPWLGGRKLWLQLIVRGFWHPTGHLGEYHLAHGAAERAVALQSQAAQVAAYLGAPDGARGMALYNLACAQARTELPDDALKSLKEAIRLNPDVLANARHDPDLDSLRNGGQFDALIAHFPAAGAP
jgi:tetratricopeptide (TPR) repeat protein